MVTSWNWCCRDPNDINTLIQTAWMNGCWCYPKLGLENSNLAGNRELLINNQRWESFKSLIKLLICSKVDLFLLFDLCRCVCVYMYVCIPYTGSLTHMMPSQSFSYNVQENYVVKL